MTSEESLRARRREALAERLAEVTGRITRGAVAAGRSPDEVTLVAVTKNFPATDVLLLGELGVVEIAENRDQEASAKAAQVAAVLGPGALRWHFVGRLQRNKVRSVVRYADVVESVDRPELVDALSTAAAAHRDTPLDVLLQVSLDPAAPPGRGGVEPADVPALADAVAAASGLHLRGVMAVAPLGMDPEPAFAQLSVVVDRLRHDHPGATVVSAGMSGDLEAALVHGATHVRVGTALLGGRTRLSE